MNPFFTIIIPVYNRQKLLPRAIKSVLDQRFEQWELIIVDDCSTDNSISEARNYIDPRITVLQTGLNSGPAAARNLGIHAARGKYISLLDSDDMFHPEFLSRTKEEIERSDEAFGFSYTAVGDLASCDLGGRKPVDNLWQIPERYSRFRKPYLYQLQIGTAAGITLKRDVFLKIGFFDETLKAAEDTDFFIRVSEFFKGWPIPELLIFKDHNTADRLTNNYSKLSEAYQTIVAKNADLIDSDPFLAKRWFYKNMWLAFYSGDKSVARESFAKIRSKGVANSKIVVVFFAGLFLPQQVFIRFHKKINQLFQ